jgi:general secretion pathway protein L
MSLLVILLPAPPRADMAAPDPAAALAWLLSPDGLVVARQGQSAPALMPRADSVVAVVPAGAIAWHRPVAPRAPAARLRAALGGLLEEQLLSDDDDTHLALAPRVVAGAPVWVAALHKPALRRQLAALAAAGLVVDRLVPALAPLLAADGSTRAAEPAAAAPGAGAALGGAAAGAAAGIAAANAAPALPAMTAAGAAEALLAAATDREAVGHFFTGADADEADTLWLAWADANGALCLPVAGALARALLPRWRALGTQFSATPAAAAAAEAWLGSPVAVRSEAEQALAAVRTRWNLLQFDLAPQHRGSMALGKLGRQLLSPAWRPARLGLLGLLLLQVLGLNVMAWQQERRLVEQRAGMEALLRSAHPQVRAVLDAPVQMQRETAALRVAAGVPGDEDFEPLLAAAAAAWPDGVPPAAQLRFETGRLNLPAVGWAPPQVDQLRARLRLAGWALDNAEGRLLIRRADDGTATPGRTDGPAASAASPNPNLAARRP